MKTSVLDLRVGDLVDLESCPYLWDHPMAKFDYGVVYQVGHETPECVVVWYEGIDAVGYPTGTILEVRESKELP